MVHVIHASDGNIPSDIATGDPDELEEERRLLYVALTRARHALHVTFPQRYHHTLRRERYSTAARLAVPRPRRGPRHARHPRPRRSTSARTAAPAIDGVASVDQLLADLLG